MSSGPFTLSTTVEEIGSGAALGTEIVTPSSLDWS